MSIIIYPKGEWNETPDAHIFKADVLGFRKEDIRVEIVEGNLLQISGERKPEHGEKSDGWHCLESSMDKFFIQFQLADNANADRTKASMENEVLSVFIPKEEVKKPKVRLIEVFEGRK